MNNLGASNELTDIYAPGRPPMHARFLSSFVGRKTELEQLHELFIERHARLVTLTGPSGVGKTRTALHAAETLGPFFDHTIWLVELGAVDDPGLAGATIARAIGAPASLSGVTEDVIIQFIGDTRALLILDSLEHLLGAAPLIAGLLTSCPSLHVLATSQTLLRLSGEHSLAIGPLPVPHPNSSTMQAVKSTDATMLFLDRARAIQKDFGQHDDDASSIAAIVRRLDGIPLAIEIAASRANVLTPQTLLARLDEGLLDFAEISRDRPVRQQTLRAAIAWSHGFLSEIEQLVFRRLSVFRGGFNLEAAEPVVDLPSYDSFLDALSGLVDWSLVRRIHPETSVERFGILAGPLEFASEQLDAAGETDATRDVHLAWFTRLAEQSETALLGPDQTAWVQGMSREQGNYRASLRWTIDKADAEAALRLSSALWRYWGMMGNLAEARSWLTQALELDGDHLDALRAKALHHLGNVELDMGDFSAARSAYEGSYDLVAAGEDQVTLARAFNGLGLVNYFQGQYTEARVCHERALTIRRAVNDLLGIGNSLTNLGDVALALGEIEPARRFHEESLSLRQSLKDQNGVGYSLFNLGVVSFHEASYERAKLLLDDSLRIMESSSDSSGRGYALIFLGRVSRELGNLSSAADYLIQAIDVRTTISNLWGIVDCIEEVATLAACIGKHQPTVELFAAAGRQRDEMGSPLSPIEQGIQDRWMHVLTGALGHQQFSDHSYAGRLFTLNQATEHATALAAEIADRCSASLQPHIDSYSGTPILSRREVEVLRLAAQGLTDQEIADTLFMSRRTATTHQANIRQKLGVQNRAEAVALASRQGII